MSQKTDAIMNGTETFVIKKRSKYLLVVTDNYKMPICKNSLIKSFSRVYGMKM